MKDKVFLKVRSRSLSAWKILKFTLHQATRTDLAAFALVSRATYAAANPLLYRTIEISFCKCSRLYFDLLYRTLSSSPKLVGFVKELVVKIETICVRVKGTTILDRFRMSDASKRLKSSIQSAFRIRPNVLSHQMNEVTYENCQALQMLGNSRLGDIISFLVGIQKVEVHLALFLEFCTF